MKLRLAHLYPDHMNIYGDRGNVLSLKQRCAWRGIELEIEAVGVAARVDWDAVDIAFFGGGQDSGQALIADDFVQHQGPGLRRAIDSGLVMLAICGGYQMLGHYFLTHTNEKLPGIGALDLHTVGGNVRLIGNIAVEAELRSIGSSINLSTPGRQDARNEESQPEHGSLNSAPPQPLEEMHTIASQTRVRLVGFENHSGRTYLGAGVRPLGRVLVGHGNNGEDGSEGAVYRNSFGCYMHGSLLPKNPQLSDQLIALALERRYGSAAATLSVLDDRLELGAQQSMLMRIVS